MLLLPALLGQLHWYGRAARLQRALGVRFDDLNLLRCAFVYPTYVPEAMAPLVVQHLVRAGTRAAVSPSQRASAAGARGGPKARAVQLRQVVQRMDSSRQLSPEAELLAAPVESYNQRLEFLGDAVLELITTHHLFVLFAA